MTGLTVLHDDADYRTVARHNLIEKPFTEAALLTKLRETLLARGPA
jgi:hypothetical protein